MALKKLREKIEAKHVTIGSLLAVGPFIWGVYAVADTAGFQLDRVAWQSDVMQLAGVVDKTQLRADQRELRQLKQEYGRLRRKVEGKKAAGQPVSPEDILQLEELQHDIKFLEDALKGQ